MSTFDSFADSPNQIRTEGQEITLKFERTSSTTARISWNIPSPSRGCTAETQAYNGIVITIDTTRTDPSKAPVDGTQYTSDPTADTNLHAGDKLGTSLVVGAFYNDKTTTYVDITGISETTAYYASGFAVDAQYRYHTEGVYAYSLDRLGTNDTDPTAGYQVVDMVDGITLSTPTTLVPGDIYDFLLNIDGSGDNQIDVNGTDAQTIGDLLDAINKQIALIENPQQTTTPPDYGTYYWDAINQDLYQWDGYDHNAIDAIVEATDPTLISIGDYWYNPTTGDLSRATAIGPVTWAVQNVVRYHQDPTTLTCDDYWYTGTAAYQWDGNVWCEKILWNQATDPSLPVYPDCGTFWYNENDSILYSWTDETNTWKAESAIYWPTDPNTPTLGDFWFDETNQTLNKWDGTWTVTAVTIGDEPTMPVANQYWYNPTTESLFQRDGANTSWTSLDVLVWETDPTVRASCDLWWDSDSPNDLYIWDVTTSSWDLVSTFIQSDTDPAAAPTLTTDDVWFNTDTEVLSAWDGTQWVAVTFITSLTDPTIPAVDDVWYNTSTGVWQRWDGAAWVVFDPIDSDVDPQTTTLPVGSFWYDTTNDLLYQWNGATWDSVTFTTMPLTPTSGTLWFNTTNDTLMEWDGTTWAVADLLATATLDENGDIRITSTRLGSMSTIEIVDGSLFMSLDGFVEVVLPTVPGTDGNSNIPTYKQIGIGDDGTPDERREMIDRIRKQLGYPVVEVELTKDQIDIAINIALEVLRQHSGAPYKRAFFFMDIPKGKQNFLLTNKTVGYNKIVNIMGIYRMSSAFLATPYGSGVYGQIVLQHLYNMGTFDLLSYHLVSQYIEQLEILFAARIVFQWNEHNRRLDIPQTFAENERVLVDASIERTEQEMFVDRFTRRWIEKYALAQCRLILAEIRGKYATLPGAGGGVSLNASELITRADQDMAELMEELDNFVVENPEEYGLGTTIVIG